MRILRRCRILAIETSCDETAIAIAEFSGSRVKSEIRVLSHILALQTKVHARFGGVVPNLARREHQKNLVPILLEALKEAKLMNAKSKIQNRPPTTHYKLQTILNREPDLLARFKKYVVPLAVSDIDAIAVTHGPGLEPALWVGVNFARALALLWDKPLIPVNHMAGHIYSALLTTQDDTKLKTQNSKLSFDTFRILSRVEGRLKNQNSLKSISYKLEAIRFPAMALLVSGGHTQLVLMRGHGKYQVLGETRDDAAGEAFDKVARLLGLGGIQGGPAVAALAEKEVKSKNEKTGKYKYNEIFSSLNPERSERVKIKINLPRPMLHTRDYDFSFSGLKTAVLYKVRELEKKYPMKEIQPVVAREFQDAAVEVLVRKTIRAAVEYKAKTVLLGGGVAANNLLRRMLGEAIGQNLPNTKYLIPDASMTGDNALMIAIAAYFTSKETHPDKIKADANASLEQ